MSETISINEMLIGGSATIFAGYIVYQLTVAKSKTMDRISKLETEVELLNEIKISEEKARMIVAQSIEPILHRQDETRNDMKEMITSVNNLSLKIAEIGLMRNQDRE